MILERQYFDESYQENEKLFSTGDEELDDILEEVYYSGLEDGYDFAQREFSSKPKNLKKYKEYEGSKMSKAQQRAAIEEEDETAAYNTGRYESKHGWRGAGIGAGTGAAAGATIGAIATRNMNRRFPSLRPDSVGKAAAEHGVYGLAGGALIGAGIGVAVGQAKAKKAGHDRDKRAVKLARKFDEENAKRGIESDLEYQTKRDIRDRHKEELDAERNYYMRQMAWNSWR